MQRIPLSDEYDPDADFGSNMDPLEFLERRLRLTPGEQRSLPSIIDHEAEIARARRHAISQAPRTGSRKFGC